MLLDIISKILVFYAGSFLVFTSIVIKFFIRDSENIGDIGFRFVSSLCLLGIGLYIFLIKLSDRIVSRYIRIFCQSVCIITIIINIFMDCIVSLYLLISHEPNIDLQRDTIIIVVLFILDIFLYKLLIETSSKIVSKYIRVFCQIVCRIAIVKNICISLFYLTFCLKIDLLGDILRFILFPMSVVGSLFSLNYTYIGVFVLNLLNILLYTIIYKKIPKDIKEIYNIFYIIVIIVNIVNLLRY